MRSDRSAQSVQDSMVLSDLQYNAAVAALTPLAHNETAQVALFNALVASWPQAITTAEELRSEFIRIQDALPRPRYVDYVSLLSLRRYCMPSCSVEACKSWTDRHL